jgi:hypothetical protein
MSAPLAQRGKCGKRRPFCSKRSTLCNSSDPDSAKAFINDSRAAASGAKNRTGDKIMITHADPKKIVRHPAPAAGLFGETSKNEAWHCYGSQAPSEPIAKATAPEDEPRAQEYHGA